MFIISGLGGGRLGSMVIFSCTKKPDKRWEAEFQITMGCWIHIVSIALIFFIKTIIKPLFSCH